MENLVIGKVTNKTPIKYWGGKQQLANKIIARIPKHRAYIEPFFGGGAVFFQKGISPVEIINDLNDNIVNFYKIIKRDFHKFHGELDLTLYSEWEWKRAKQLWQSGFEEDKVLRAWWRYLL